MIPAPPANLNKLRAFLARFSFYAADGMADAAIVALAKEAEMLLGDLPPVWPEDLSDYGSRIAVIGQNGNEGTHYAAEPSPSRLPDRLKYSGTHAIGGSLT